MCEILHNEEEKGRSWREGRKRKEGKRRGGDGGWKKKDKQNMQEVNRELTENEAGEIDWN